MIAAVDGHQADAQSRGDQPGRRGQVCRFQDDPRLELRCGTKLVEQSSHAESRVHGDEGFVGEIGHGHRRDAREPVAVRDGDAEPLTKQAAPGQRWPSRPRRNHPDVDGPGLHEIADRFGGALLERERHSR